MKELRGKSITGKLCSGCGEWKDLELLVKNKKYTTGRRALCKSCDALRSKARYAQKAEEINERRRATYNPDKASARNKKYYSENKEKFSEYAKAAWEAADKEAERSRSAKWRAENPEKVRELWKRKDRKRRATAKGRVDDAIARGIHRGLRKGEKAGRKTFDILGYSSKELMDHLEKHFQPGMTWDNYGRDGWEIDHIIPRSAFNYETPDDIDFKRCWALENLQPLWMGENRTKRHKLESSFQPSLAISEITAAKEATHAH